MVNLIPDDHVAFAEGLEAAAVGEGLQAGTHDGSGVVILFGSHHTDVLDGDGGIDNFEVADHLVDEFATVGEHDHPVSVVVGVGDQLADDGGFACPGGEDDTYSFDP